MEQNHIFIKLLGSPEIRMDGQAVKLPFRQAEAMVYYLAVSGSVSKDRLCDLLWGDRYPEDKAKSSLRNAICVVRNRLGRDVLTEPTRQHIALNPDCGVQVDAAVYLRPGTELGGSGEFLSGFRLKGSEVFDEWSAAMAQTIRDAYCTRAKTAVEEAWGREDTEGCLQLCRELIAANEYDEFGYRYLMLCLSRKQDYGAALNVYQQLRRLLAEDLFQEPEEETEQTARDIRELRRASLSNLPLGRPLRERGPEEAVYGREEELQTLLDALNGFFRGSPAASQLIRGEMGVGKTFLLEHALRRTDTAGGRVVTLRCYSAETAVPLKVYYDLLTQLLSGEEDSADKEQLRRTMAILLPQTARPANSLVGQETTGLIETLLSCCRKRRLLVAVDDLQWADPASLALIHNILTLDKNRSILFVMTCRSEPAPEADSLLRSLKLTGLLREYLLPPFTYDQTMVFARTFLPDRTVDEAFAQTLYRESDGNPLFLSECLNSIRFGGGMAGLTPRLTDIIRQRIDSLPTESAKLLELISIAPDGADFEMLAEISQQDDYALSETLEGLLDRQLLREEDEGGRVVFRFVHQKILEYTYDHISAIRRRLLHGKMAACLEARVPPDGGLYDCSRLIYHLERSGQLLKYLQYVLRNIVGYLNMSQEFFPLVQEARPPLVFREEERGVAVLELGSLEHYLGAVEQKIRDNPQIFRQPEARSAVMEFYTLQAQHYVHQADYPKAFAYVETLRRLSSPQDTPEWRKYLLKANHFLAALYMDRNDIPRLRVTIRESQALLAQVEDPEIWATWMRLQGVCEVIAGDYAEAYQRLSGAADLFLSFDNADVYAYSVGACWAWMGEALRLQGDSDAAELLYRQAITLCENSRASGGIAVFYAFYARCLLDRDVPREQDEDRAEAMLARGRELCGQFNLLWYRGVTYAYSALSACRRGEAEQAGRFLREARSAAARLESSYEQAVAEEITQRVRQAFSAAPEQLRRFEAALRGA